MCSVAVVNHITGCNWGMQTENESGGDMTNSILYHLIEKTENKLQNYHVNSPRP
jgi:hypothetical protein